MGYLNLEEYIRTVPDYPVEGIHFYDLNSLFASEAWPQVVEELVEKMDHLHFTHIVGIESRGFVVAQAIASELKKPMVMVSKKGAK